MKKAHYPKPSEPKRKMSFISAMIIASLLGGKKSALTKKP